MKRRKTSNQHLNSRLKTPKTTKEFRTSRNKKLIKIGESSVTQNTAAEKLMSKGGMVL